ncbi:tRNA (adenosine(37)-N6)-threonylcarbamoyltransferase complex dimerization subunit type 1 TsaB [Candidatus Saccharibacteria bacterium]|nr:tRNA (adenosine(37)-N6)-threonylcarbamoyltransferase complex dimerization subunit type 1 TsaB [Candidatus Saccharibacteria bacterium]
MIILTIRTDKPESEVGLYDDSKQIAYFKWQAHRELAETIHKRIKEILDNNKLSMGDIEGIVVYKGPGSFTGLRIGISVANSLSYSLGPPIVGVSKENWIENGIKAIQSGKNDKSALPEYGAPVFTTKPKK